MPQFRMSKYKREQSLWNYCGIHSDEEKIAKKEHSCSWCGKGIRKYERYRYIRLDFDELPHIRRIKLCLECYSEMHIHRLIDMAKDDHKAEIQNFWLDSDNNEQQIEAQTYLMNLSSLRIGYYVTFFDDNDSEKTGIVKMLGEKGAIVADEMDKWKFRSFEELWPALITDSLVRKLGFSETISMSITWDLDGEDIKGPTSFDEYEMTKNGYDYHLTIPNSNTYPSVLEVKDHDDQTIMLTRKVFFIQQLQYLIDKYSLNYPVGIDGDVDFVFYKEYMMSQNSNSKDTVPESEK